MATYDLTPGQNLEARDWFLVWALKRLKQNAKTNLWSRESYCWLNPGNNNEDDRDGNDGAPSYIIADLAHNLGSYEVKEDLRL